MKGWQQNWLLFGSRGSIVLLRKWKKRLTSNSAWKSFSLFCNSLLQMDMNGNMDTHSELNYVLASFNYHFCYFQECTMALLSGDIAAWWAWPCAKNALSRSGSTDFSAFAAKYLDLLLSLDFVQSETFKWTLGVGVPLEKTHTVQ